MLILTQDRKARSQLSLLLRDLGYRPQFHTELDGFLAGLADQETPDTCLVDVDMDLDAATVDQLRSAQGDEKVIGFECFRVGVEAKADKVSSLYSSVIILPAHAERAKLRLKHVLNPSSFSVGPNRLATRSPFPVRRSFTNGLGKIPGTKQSGLSNTPANARYLTCESPTTRQLVNSLKQKKSDTSCLILEAQEDAEFELVAREINFVNNGDRLPLELIDGAHLSIDYLQVLERQATKARTTVIAYAGRLDSLSEPALKELVEFIDYLSSLRNPHLRLILSHEKGSEPYFQDGVAELLPKLESLTETIQIPSLLERPEDIPSICQILIGAMRTAHPFLLVSRVSPEAVAYLIEERADYSYGKLVRTLRNSFALCRHRTLMPDDIKNFGESDMTTQHLLESMADESYFPTAGTANL